MLLIFTFSITPKKYLHDLVADHKDFYFSASGDEASINQTGVNCHCDDLVVSTPFIEVLFEQELSPVLFHKEGTSSLYHFYFLNTHRTKDSRGPPAIA